MRFNKLAVLCGVLVSTFFVGCGGGSGGGGTTPPATLAITTPSPLTAGTVNAAYSLTLTASGGTAPFSWAVSTGTLPAGLALSTTGILSGTPTAAGSNSFTVKVTDSGSPAQTATLAATLAITPPLLTITTSSPLPAGTIGTAYSDIFTATGGTGADSWTITAGTLPAGLTLSAAGVLSGTPTTAGTSSFTVTATDSGSPAQTAILAAMLTINPIPPAITTTSPLPTGLIKTAYSTTLAATGGVAPYAWSVSAGTLPAGLNLSSLGVLSGTPTAAGTSTFTITLSDSETPAKTATLAATLTINAPLAIATTSPLTAGTVNAAYTDTLMATGGLGAYAWTVASGTLPPGLTLSSAGVLSGTPTAVGTSTFTVQVVDSETPPQTATLAATLVINDSAISITTTSPLPQATVNTAYVDTLAATGGTPPYTWSLSTGTLPAGITLTPTGIISGTPTTTGSSSFTVKVADAAGGTMTAPLILTVNVGTLAVTSTSLPGGYEGSPYVAQLAASGGVPPYTWSVTGGTLPAGIVLNTAGLFSGTPGAVTTASPTFTVTDSTGKTATASLPITINAATGTVPDNYYSFVFAGISPQGTPVAQNGVAINGIIKIVSGQVASGYYDENTNTNPPILEAALSGGTLVVGANGLGQLVLTTPTGTMTFALAKPASVSTGGLTPIRMIEYDDATGAGSRGSGVIDPTPGPPTTAGISGNFAFLLSGTDIDQNQQALIGSFQTNGAGAITGGTADANQVIPGTGREVANLGTLGGTYTIDGNGRGLLTLTFGTSPPFHYSFYEVSPSEWLVISLDPATLNSPLVSGTAYQQSGAPFSAASLPATSVLAVNGVNTTGTAPVPDVSLGLATSDGSGNVTYTFDEYNGTLTTGNTATVAYSVDATTGRTTATAGYTTAPIVYLISDTQAFYVGVSPSGQSGMIEQQTGAPFTVASFDGNYLGGSLPLVLTSVLNESGLVTADGAGNVNFTTNRSSSTGLVYQNDVVAGTYTVDATGRGVITAPDGVTRIFYVVSPTQIDFLTSDTGGYLGSFQQ